ncbi:hypothetical protein AKJ09_03237 [Labilithrix luteola]|uniref:Uncharacterized protein n=1 Tax=Labilithrix luteola TaxID=1391654 RepID=A0A0K1PSR0_9BACT|nr:hypothetical protein [Labilithrix luteola]AKU96573.1 hypothetical protein AKJ09_03237 [Labilithrix luteola]
MSVTPPRLLGGVIALVVAVIGGTPRVAHAETSFALTWRSESTGAPPCVTDKAVREAVEAALGRSPFTDRGNADIVLEGSERRVGTRYQARVTQRDRTGAELGSRDLDADSCPALRRMTTVVVTLFVEPGQGSEPDKDEVDRPAAPPPMTPPASRATLGGPSTEPVPPRARVHARRPPDEREPPARLYVGLGGGAAVGLLPGPSASIRGVARLELGRSGASFDWSLGYSLPQTVVDARVRATFSAVDQQLRACAALARAPATRLDACGGVFFGAIIPDARGISDIDGSAESLFGPTASLGLRVAQRPGLHVELGFAVPKRHRSPNYVARSGEVRTLYTTGAVIGLASLTGTIPFF